MSITYVAIAVGVVTYPLIAGWVRRFIAPRYVKLPEFYQIHHQRMKCDCHVCENKREWRDIFGWAWPLTLPCITVWVTANSLIIKPFLTLYRIGKGSASEAE